MPTWYASGKTHSSRCQAKGSARADMGRGIPSKSLDGMDVFGDPQVMEALFLGLAGRPESLSLFFSRGGLYLAKINSTQSSLGACQLLKPPVKLLLDSQE